MKKIIRVTTISGSLWVLLRGQLKYINQFYEVIGVASDGPHVKKLREEEGIAYIPVAMTREITPLKDLSALWQLYRVFKREKPFIVHTHTPKAGTLGMMAAKLAGVKHRLHTVAGLPLMEAKGKKRKLLNGVERVTYLCATMVYPNSKGLEQLILDHNFTRPEKLKVLANGSSNGINVNKFSPESVSISQRNDLKEELDLASDDIVLIFVGRMVRDKGINELITAFKKLSAINTNLKLLLVGPYEEDLDPISPDARQEINTNPSIIAAGWQEDVRPYFAISDLLVFPSYREGFPNVVLQAGAMGLPSIVSNINGCNEIVQEGVNGLIIPVKSADAIQKAVQRLLDDSMLRQSMSDRARAVIVDQFDQKMVWEAILNEYKQLED